MSDQFVERKYMEGWVEKKANKWRKYFAVLVGSRMYFYKSEKTTLKDQAVGHLEVSGPDVVSEGETKKKVCCFSLTSQTGTYELRVGHEETRTQWIAAIKECGGDVQRGAGGYAPPLPSSSRPSGLSSSTSSRPLPSVPRASSSPPSSPHVSRSSTGGGGNPEFTVPPPDPSLPFSDKPWHFGKTTRSISEKLLERHGSEGSFLLRASESTPGDYSLSVLDQGKPRHYKITTSSRGLLLTGCEDEAFKDLSDLVQYYVTASRGRSNPLDKFAVEKMEQAFSAPVIVREGAMLPGMKIQMEMEEQMRTSSISSRTSSGARGPLPPPPR